jgi:hypothetical protein
VGNYRANGNCVPYNDALDQHDAVPWPHHPDAAAGNSGIAVLFVEQRERRFEYAGSCHTDTNHYGNELGRHSIFFTIYRRFEHSRYRELIGYGSNELRIYRAVVLRRVFRIFNKSGKVVGLKAVDHI